MAAETSSQDPIRKSEVLVANYLHGREKEWADLAYRNKPLELLDLPLDILQAVLKEVTHTNDLTALALTHSALHSLVIPHIYSRFDIVWPEANPTVESRVGVDALTYGLATLVMAHDVFGEADYQQQRCEHCDHSNRTTRYRSEHGQRPYPTAVRRGNYFAQHTKKFSLGNGPPDWVTEYLITKEGGKMLGTLVALAVGRMRNLEAFIWDMPTGVLRDVWLALASLGNRQDGQDCRLERVWVRWHDNRDAAPLTSPPPPGTGMMHHPNLPTLLGGTATSLFQIPPYPSVEFPTFSILPPLKSLSVLDIDELPYAEEMSLLIERSLGKLQELRVGVAAHAQRDIPFRPIEDRSNVPPPFLTGDEHARPGGLLGILVSRFCSAFSLPMQVGSLEQMTGPLVGGSLEQNEDLRTTSNSKETGPHGEVDVSEINQLGVLLSAQSLQDDSEPQTEAPIPIGYQAMPSRPTITPLRRSNRSSVAFAQSSREDQHRKLKLQTLELERVYLSIGVLSRAIDWACLKSLTLLGCMNHEQLWKVLRKNFTPMSIRNRTPSSSKINSALPRSRASSSSYCAADPSEYKLNIRRIHTDTVSNALLAFIKDTLAPDTLEWLFLQETNAYKPTVTIDQIYRTAVRRHRNSLKKLLVDSEIRTDPNLDRERDREPADTNWRRWVFHREFLTCITSGKMQLRELSLSIDYKDWHFFLQRLPMATSLRSLHISHIAEHPYGRSFEPREIALQILDIISLKPEIELCYLGVERKCFELLEHKASSSRRGSPVPGSHGTIGITTHTQIENDEEEDDHDDGTNLGIDPDAADNSDAELDDWDAGSNSADDDEEEEQVKGDLKPAFKLREILFYDDKISIFKARHGKL